MTNGPLGDALDGRHPGTVHVAKHFAYDHLREPARTVKARLATTAEAMVRALPDGPELTAGLRKLLEASDCFVRATFEKVNGDD